MGVDINLVMSMGINSYILAETYLKNYLVKKRLSSAGNYLSLIRLIDDDVITDVNNKKCPFCKKEFKTRIGLKNHLLNRRAACNTSLNLYFSSLINEYMKIKYER